MKTYLSLKKPLQKLCESIFNLSHWQSFAHSAADYFLTPLTHSESRTLTQNLRSLASQVKASFMKVLPTKKSRLKTQTVQSAQCSAHVFKGVFAGLDALVLAIVSNKRKYVGLLLMFGISPISYCTYDLLFSYQDLQVIGWFHYNFFHFFFLVRWPLAAIVWLVGLFHYLPKDRGVKVLAFPLGWCFMALFQSVMADSNEDVWEVVNIILLGAGISFALMIFLFLDYFIWRKFHREDAFEKRFEGIYRVHEDLPLDKIGSMFIQTMHEKKNFNNSI
jgi:hypothetical protein